jgi:hypothetical protein
LSFQEKPIKSNEKNNEEDKGKGDASRKRERK